VGNQASLLLLRASELPTELSASHTAHGFKEEAQPRADHIVSGATAANSTGMPGPVRMQAQHELAADLSDVQVKPESARARELKALAFTQGNEIHVAPGHWAPDTVNGQKLLGHELAHVLQQRAGRVRATVAFGGAKVNDDPTLEREADAGGARAAHTPAWPAQFGAERHLRMPRPPAAWFRGRPRPKRIPPMIHSSINSATIRARRGLPRRNTIPVTKPG
jgi:hypothetical protein